MKITTSYAVEIRHADKIFRNTNRIYKDAVFFCINAFEEQWDVLKGIDTAHKERFAYADSLIHSTKTNTAVYADFDRKFHKLPSYLRFSVINTALGYLSSYHSNVSNWEETDQKGSRPAFQQHQNRLPVFYKENMYRECEDSDTVLLKVFVNNDWNWMKVHLKHTDVMCIRKKQQNAKISVPSLERRHKKWFLRFSFEESVKLNDTKPEEQKILAVDLGINTDAVCSVMKMDGTVLARKFIDFSCDKDHLQHTLNKIKKIQREYGSYNTKKLWRQARSHNDELARKTAKSIVQTAVQHDCDVIVFEHLDIRGRKKGSKKQKLAMWKKNTIQAIATTQAHRNGIHISRICAWGTSKLAYDGSGIVSRGNDANFDTNKLCLFPSGKVYNCDLSASYNIGARYFIRETEKSIPAKEWSDITAKVPECQKRTQCTYHTLLQINSLR